MKKQSKYLELLEKKVKKDKSYRVYLTGKGKAKHNFSSEISIWKRKDSPLECPLK